MGPGPEAREARNGNKDRRFEFTIAMGIEYVFVEEFYGCTAEPNSIDSPYYKPIILHSQRPLVHLVLCYYSLISWKG